MIIGFFTHQKFQTSTGRIDKSNPARAMALRYYSFLDAQAHSGGFMDAISHSTARANLASIMTSVCDDHVPVAITREGEAPVVMISLADYNAMQETMYLLGTQANARELLESIAELESGNGIHTRNR